MPQWWNKSQLREIERKENNTQPPTPAQRKWHAKAQRTLNRYERTKLEKIKNRNQWVKSRDSHHKNGAVQLRH